MPFTVDDNLSNFTSVDIYGTNNSYTGSGVSTFFNSSYSKFGFGLLITLSTQAGMLASSTAFQTWFAAAGITSTTSLQVRNTGSAAIVRQPFNARAMPDGGLATMVGGQRYTSMAIVFYTSAISSPPGNFGMIVFSLNQAAAVKFMEETTSADFGTPAANVMWNQSGSAMSSTTRAEIRDATRYVATETESPDEAEEEEVVEGTPPAVVEPPAEEMTIGGGPAMSMVSPVVIYPGGAGGGTPNPTGGASVALVPISGAGTLARFVVTLPGFARTATGFSFTNNAVARAAWTVTKAALAGLGLTQLVDLIDELADDAVLLFRLGGGGVDYSVGDMIGNASVTKVWEANDVPFLALSDGRLGARKSTGMWRFWRPRRPIVLYSDGAKDLKTGIKAGKALIKQAREMRKLSNALLGTQKEKRKSPTPYHHHEQGTTIRNIEVT